MLCPFILSLVPRILSAVSSPANHVFSFDFLQDNTSVETLDLSDNRIGDAGIVALAKALEVGFQFLRCLCILKIGTHMLSPPTKNVEEF